MTKKLELYDGSKSYMYPNGEIATPERVTRDFPAVKRYPHMVETDEAGQVLFAIQNIAAMHSHHDLAVPQEVLDLTEAMQEMHETEQAAWAAEVALNTAQAMLTQPLPLNTVAMESQDISRQIEKTGVEAQRQADMEAASDELKKAEQKIRTVTNRYAKRVDAMKPTLAALEKAVNKPVVEEASITAEDRIVAALELLCLINMPDA